MDNLDGNKRRIEHSRLKMNFSYKFKKWLRSDHKYQDLSNWFRGNIMYFLYMNGFSFMLREKDILRYYDRLKYLDPKCAEEGECEFCDCSVPMMFMVKDCKGSCARNGKQI